MRNNVQAIKKNIVHSILSVPPFRKAMPHQNEQHQEQLYQYQIAKKKIVVRLNTSSLWNEWFEGNEKKKKKAHATQMSHFISFPCYLRCWLEWKEYCVLYIFFQNSRFFFCHAIIRIFIVYEKPNIGLMQGCVCCLSESIILEIAASEFLSQNGNKLLLYCCQMTPRK